MLCLLRFPGKTKSPLPTIHQENTFKRRFQRTSFGMNYFLHQA